MVARARELVALRRGPRHVVGERVEKAVDVALAECPKGLLHRLGAPTNLRREWRLTRTDALLCLLYEALRPLAETAALV
jgi:hypothetical protein